MVEYPNRTVFDLVFEAEMCTFEGDSARTREGFAELRFNWYITAQGGR